MRKATSYMPLSWRKPERRLDAAGRKQLLRKRQKWLNQIDPISHFHQLFDFMPGVYFFAKNRQGELMFTCKASRGLYHLADEASVIGLTDYDLNPPDMAQSYVNDDRKIFETGKPILSKVELWFDEEGMPDWFLVHKVPVRSKTGRIIGIMGFSQSYESRSKLLHPFPGISKAVSHLRQNFAEEISMVELARLAGLSLRQLQRNFKSCFGVGPQQFLIKTRLLAACRKLRETDDTMAEIALMCGFPDQSAFAHHFREHFGFTPTRFRHREHIV